MASNDALTQLNQVLVTLASSDNDVRSHAEAQLNDHWIAKQPDLLLLSLAQLGRSHESTHLRSFAFVLLRRIATKPAPVQLANHVNLVWDVLSEQTQEGIKGELLSSLSVEQEGSVRHKVCDAISEIAKYYFLKELRWPELLHALLEASKLSSPEHREAAFRIFSAVPSIIIDQSIDELKQIFAMNLQDAANPGVRMTALKAAVAFMLLTDNARRASFSELMPDMLTVLAPLVKKDDDELVDGLMVLIELAENKPRVFRHVLPTLVPFCLTLVKDKEVEDGTRQTALELLLTLAEVSPSMMRKAPSFITQIVPNCLEMMTELEETEDWYTTDDLDDDDNDENAVIGEHAMDRLARALGGNAILPASFQYIPGMLGNERWEQRHAALMAISAIAEGCMKTMESKLGTIIELVLPYLCDPNARVRYAACNAVGQMSTDFSDSLQRNFHQPVLTALIPVMEAPEPRVQAHAAAALVNFCEAAEKTVLEPYLDTIFSHLLVLLNSGRTYVQEQAITTIATVADSAQDCFVKYYNAIVPLLINVLRNAHQKEYRLLRGKAMECASLIALAVGKDIFNANAREVIELLVQTQQSVTEADDPQVSYLIAAWARVCKVLGHDFVPYLPIVIPPLLTSAQLKPDFAIVDSEEDIDKKYAPEDGWQFVPMEGQQVGIKTTVLEEKNTAVEMLICYARELGAAFQPYTEQVLDIVLPLLKFYFHDGIRHAAAITIPHLLTCVKKAECGADYILNMWHTICDKLLGTMLTERDFSFSYQLYITFYESLETVGDNSMKPHELEQFTRATELQLEEFHQRLRQRDMARANADFDAEDEEIISEEEQTDESLLGEISKAIHVVLKTHGEGYLQFFDKLLPVVTTFLNDPNASARQWALCVFDDVVEFTGPTSWNYQAHFLEKMLALLTDPAPDVRQAASYGIGVCAQFGGENYTVAAAAALEPLFQVINTQDARKEDNVYATENAVSAVTKILKFNCRNFDANTVIPAWFNALPIIYDEEEAPLTCSYLLELLESSHPAILGNNNENIPRLVNIIVDVLVASVLPDDLASHCVTAVKAVLGGFTEDVRSSLWNSIDPEKRNTLQEKKYF